MDLLFLGFVAVFSILTGLFVTGCDLLMEGK
jgi:hypothetical protein